MLAVRFLTGGKKVFSSPKLADRAWEALSHPVNGYKGFLFQL
jgi:hypothetical protein